MKGVFPTSIGDDLLRWASEAGAGGWERLRDVCSYLTYKHERNRRPWVVASELSQLGHLDINWETRSWSIAPPALNLVPGLGICLVLTGSRPHYIDERFNEATSSMDVYPFSVEQEHAPSAKFAKCASVEVAQLTADRFGSRLIVDPASQLISVLRPIGEISASLASPPALDEAEFFDSATLEWNRSHHGKPGLYRLELHGRKTHRRLDRDGVWTKVDLSLGQFQELQWSQTPVLRWIAPTENEPAYLDVRRELSLPLIAERAAVICSGFLPKQVGKWRRYGNVPESIARSLSTLLRSPLSLH